MHETNYGVALLPAAARACAQLRKWSRRQRCGGRRGRLDGGRSGRLRRGRGAALGRGDRVAVARVVLDHLGVSLRDLDQLVSPDGVVTLTIVAVNQLLRLVDPHVHPWHSGFAVEDAFLGHCVAARDFLSDDRIEQVARLRRFTELSGFRLGLLGRALGAADREDDGEEGDDEVLDVHDFLPTSSC